LRGDEDIREKEGEINNEDLEKRELYEILFIVKYKIFHNLGEYIKCRI